MKKSVKLAAIGLVAVMVAAPMPAFAAFCSNEGPKAPMTVDSDGRLIMDTEAQESLDQQRLREAGIQTTSVERWNGCLRAYVVQADGSKAMQLFDPASLRPLR